VKRLDLPASLDSLSTEGTPISAASPAAKEPLAFSCLPASYAQQRFWFFDRLTGGTDTSYNVPIALRLVGPLDVASLQRAAHQLVSRHEVLRSRLAMIDEEVVQLIDPHAGADFSVMRASERDVPHLLRQLERYRFDLSKGPLLRLVLIEVQRDLHFLAINVHHAVCDGWSISILLNDLAALYAAAATGQRVPLHPLKLQYGDFAAWQRDELEAGDARQLCAYWKEAIAGAPTLIDLPLDRLRPERKTNEGARIEFRIDHGMTLAVRKLASREGVTPFMVYLAALHVLLSELAGERDTVVGTPIGSRPSVELEGVVGCFVNTLALRVKSSDGMTVSELLAHVKRVSLAAFDHQEFPFEALVEELQPPRSLSYTPVFQVLFAYQNVPKWSGHFGETTVEVLQQTFDFGVSRMDLTCNVSERADGTLAYFEYSTDVFERDTIDSWVQLFLGVLHAVCVEQSPIGKLAPVGELRARYAKRVRVPQREAREEYWSMLLADAPPGIEWPLATRSLAPEELLPKRATLPLPLSEELAASWTEFAIGAGVSEEVVLLAAYAVLIRRIARQPDIVVLSSVVATTEQNTPEDLLLRFDLSAGVSFRQFAQAVDRQVRHAARFSLPLASVYACLARCKSEVWPDALFSMLNGEPRREPGGSAAGADRRNRVHLTFTRTGGGLQGSFSYEFYASEGPTIQALPSLFARLLEGMLREPDRDVLALPQLTHVERELAVSVAKGLSPIDVPYRTLAQPFEEQVRRSPDAVALVGEEGELTYSELNARSNRLARYLAQLGVRPGDVVGICMDRSFAMFVALYATAKAGGAYMPADPELPAERLRFMLEESGAAIVISHSLARASVPAGEWRLVDLDAIEEDLLALSGEDVPADQPPNSIAYLMYTSGSTGRPKAVTYPVDAVLLCTYWLQREYPIAHGESHLFKTPFGFDVSTWEIFWALYFGGKVVVCLPGGHRDPGYLVDRIEEHAVVSVNFVPTMLQIFLDHLPPAARCCSVRWILCGGEPMTVHLRESFFAREWDCSLVNLAGATETHTVVRATMERDQGSFVPMGRPAADYRLYVLDENHEPVPAGVVGEWYIAGRIGLAHGYHARPALTAEKFLPDPFGPPGQRMYRTGDLCRRTEDGILEHLGREDSQVKLRGLRIDLGEVEQTLSSHEQVRACVVLPIERESGAQLVAFIVPNEASAMPDPGRLRNYLRESLPRAMVPVDYVAVSRIPTTANGKVNKKELVSAWDGACISAAEAVAPPETALEARLKAVFEDVLQVATVGVDRSFFDLGGHSLLVFKLTAACQREFSVDIPIVEVFSRSSVRDLAAWIEQDQHAGGRASCLVQLAVGAEEGPIIVCIHAASGSALPFLPLARQLAGEFDVFAFQAPGVDGDREPLGSLHQYAAHYEEALTQLDRARPLLLVGWSMGGNIAIEVGRRLRARERPQECRIALLDSTPAGAQTDIDLIRLKYEEDVAIGEITAIKGCLVDAGLSAGSVEGLVRVLDTNFAIMGRERQQWFDGDIDVFMASGDSNENGSPPSQAPAADLGWARHARGVAAHAVAGTHFDMLAEQHVRRLADGLRGLARSLRPDQVPAPDGATCLGVSAR